MAYSGACAQCGRSCDPDYRLCDECQEIEDEANTTRCEQCRCSIPPDDRLCDDCQAIADEAEEHIENELARSEEEY